MDTQKNKILVTGGAGNIASALIERLILDENNYVVVFDNLSTGFLSKLPSKEKKNWEFIKGDVNELNEIEPVMKKHQFHYIFHFAAVVGVQRTQENPAS